MDIQYFVEVNGKQQGPFTFSQLSSLQLNEHTMVWTPGQDNWVEAKELKELSSLITPLPPTPPPLKKRHNFEIELIVLGIFGIIYILIVSASYPPETMVGIYILSFSFLILRIYSVYLAVKVAKKRKQDVWNWGLATFIFPSVVLIIMGFIRPKIYN